MVLKQVTVEELIKELACEAPRLGEAYVLMNEVINFNDMGYSMRSNAEDAAYALGYEVSFFEDEFTCEKIREAYALINQRLGETLDDMCDYVISNMDVVKSYVCEYGETKVIEALSCIKTNVESHNQADKAKKLDVLIEDINNMPISQLVTIKKMMRDYMFKVDEDLFGLQTNDFRTTGSIIDDFMVICNKGFSEYDYAAVINRSMSGGAAKHISIAILFSCEKNSNIAKVDFFAHREKYISERAVGYGPFVGDFGNITVDLNVPEKAKIDICNKLNESMIRLLEFCKEHPEVDTIMQLNEEAVNFGKL